MYYCENGIIDPKSSTPQIIKNRIARRIAELAIEEGVSAIRINVEYDNDDIQYTIKSYNGRNIISVTTIASIE